MVAAQGSILSGLGNVGGAPRMANMLNSGLRTGDALKNSALARSQVQRQNGIQDQEMARKKAMEQAMYLNKLGKQWLSADPAQRNILLAGDPIMQQMGVDPTALANLSEDEVKAFVAKTEPLMGNSDLDVTKSSKMYANGLTVQSTGQGVRVIAPTGEVLTGQAAQEAIKEAAEFETQQQQDIYFGRSAGKVQGERAGGVVELEEDKAASKIKGKGTEERRVVRIDVGKDAAKGLPTINRALLLLDRVETGGPESISLAVKQRLGLESADEGELSNKLGKAVLSQLKDTFGAQFTVEEGARLERIEASFGKNTATNKRLLKELQQLSTKKAKQAIQDALAIEDFETAAAIKRDMSFQFDEDADMFGASPEPKQGGASRFQIEVVE